MSKGLCRIVLVAFLTIGCLGIAVQQSMAAEGLKHDAHTRGPVPIPASERTLQTVTADTWFKVATKNDILEGAIFDAAGNMLFCDVTNQRVLRITPDKKLSTVVNLDGFSPGGLCFRKDGRLFIAAMSADKGTILSVNPDGSDLQTVIGTDAGFMPNDLVFDTHGGFYFSDFQGTSTDPKGGVYYVPPDFKSVKPVLPNLAMANGVTLSPDGKVLWTTEFSRNLLHRIELGEPGTIAYLGSAIPYSFVGPAPDSMRTDMDGNVYVAVYGQGKVMAFNKNGIPIGQILLPGRDQGVNLRSTSLAIRPGANDLYSVTSDAENKEGAIIFHSKAFGNGVPPLNAR